MSAEVGRYAFDAVSEYMVRKKQTKRGKNITKVLFESYSYEVIDLGKDVGPEVVVKNVIEKRIKLVGLSDLMKTTVMSIEEIIKLLNEEASWCKVMVGGVVLTEKYSKSIGANHYLKDSMSSVYYAQEVLGY